MKCDNLQRYSLDVDYEEQAFAVPDDDGTYMDASDVMEAIAELKAENERLKDELDAANNQCENLINSATDIMLRQDKVNDAKCDEIESLKATHYAEMVDAGMRERRLKRALWMARANKAESEARGWYHSDAYIIKYDGLHNIKGVLYGKGFKRYPEEWMKLWIKIERLCLAKAEEYK